MPPSRVVEVSYSDILCKNPFVVEFTGLNTCIRTGRSAYKYVTATSSLVRTEKYTDFQCTLDAVITETSYADGVCSERFKTYISSRITFTTDVAVVYER